MISTTLEMDVRGLKPWLERETTSLLQPLNEKGRKIVEKVKERLNDACETCEKLAEDGSREAERGKAGRRARVTERLARYFLKQMEKIVLPEKMSYTALDGLNKELQKMFSNIARERNAWFPHISPLFIITRKRVDFAFSRLAGAISELNTFLSNDYSKGRAVEELFSKADEMTRLFDDLATYGRRKTNIAERLQFFQTKIEESKKNVEAIRGSAELGNLAQVNQEIQQLRRQVKHDLRHLQKPIMKFVNLRDSGYALTSEEVEKLGQYLEDPFMALSTESLGYPALKGILRKVERAIDDGKLKLKSSRLKKAKEDIDTILSKNTLDNIQRSCTKTYQLNQQLASSEEARMADRKLKHSQRRLEELRKRRQMVTARLETLEAGHVRLLEKVKEQKEKLEESVSDVLGKRVNLEL